MDDDDIRMAKELGMAAGSLVKNIPARGQMWKLPVKEWVRELWDEKFRRGGSETDPTYGGDSEFNFFPYETRDDLSASLEPAGRSREELRIAGTYVAREFSLLPEVVRVVLFGSVAEPGVNQCRDVDLAVWLTDLSRLKALQNARGEALNRLLSVREIDVMPVQVDVHLLEPGRDRYRGRLCYFSECPERHREPCMVDGCGAQPYLRQMEEYRHDRERFALGNREILFERPGAEVWVPFNPGISDDDVPF